MVREIDRRGLKMKAMKKKNSKGYTIKIGKLFKTIEKNKKDMPVISRFIGYNQEEYIFLKNLIPKLLEYCETAPRKKGSVLEFHYNFYSGYEEVLEEDVWLDFLLDIRRWKTHNHLWYHHLGEKDYRKRHLIWESPTYYEKRR